MELDSPKKLLSEINAKEVIVKSEQNKFGKELREKSKEIDEFAKTPEFDNYFIKAEADLKKREMEICNTNVSTYDDFKEHIKDKVTESIKDDYTVEEKPVTNRQSFLKRIIHNFLNII